MITLLYQKTRRVASPRFLRSKTSQFDRKVSSTQNGGTCPFCFNIELSYQKNEKRLRHVLLCIIANVVCDYANCSRQESFLDATKKQYPQVLLFEKFRNGSLFDNLICPINDAAKVIYIGVAKFDKGC